jgi:hypothetical protein
MFTVKTMSFGNSLRIILAMMILAKEVFCNTKDIKPVVMTEGFLMRRFIWSYNMAIEKKVKTTIQSLWTMEPW